MYVPSAAVVAPVTWSPFASRIDTVTPAMPAWVVASVTTPDTMPFGSSAALMPLVVWLPTTVMVSASASDD